MITPIITYPIIQPYPHEPASCPRSVLLLLALNYHYALNADKVRNECALLSQFDKVSCRVIKRKKEKHAYLGNV